MPEGWFPVGGLENATPLQGIVGVTPAQTSPVLSYQPPDRVGQSCPTLRPVSRAGSISSAGAPPLLYGLQILKDLILSPFSAHSAS